MTISARGQECRWCRASLAKPAGPGRPRLFCRPSCRQAAYRARRLASGHGLADGEVVVRAADLEELSDRAYVLTTALEDVEMDIEDATRPEDLRAALEHLQEAARPLAEIQLRPLAYR